jgi:hypothetical protein
VPRILSDDELAAMGGHQPQRSTTAGIPLTAEHRAKLSERLKGRTFSEERKEKISAALTGRTLTAEHCAKLSKPKTEQAKKRMSEAAKVRKASDSCRQKMSESLKGERNPRYGKPCAEGSGTGWSGWYKGWFFRSLGELRYVLETEKAGFEWSSASRYRFVYFYEGKKRTYTPDIKVYDCITEIKPERLFSDEEVLAKKQAAEPICAALGLEYAIVASVPIEQERLHELLKCGQVRLVDKWMRRYVEMYGWPNEDDVLFYPNI